MKPKFAPGDEIVVIRASSGDAYKNGDKGKIQALDALWENMRAADEYSLWQVYFDNGDSYWLFEEEMEHVHIATSPLYKAMR